jgi:hypothetical protein
MKFNQLVDSILREGIGDPEAAAAAAAAGNAALSHRFSSYDPQPSYSRGSSVERNAGLKENPLGMIMVQWKEGEEAKPLRHPETKETLKYRYLKAQGKIEQLKSSGRYARVFFRQTESD